MEQIERLRADIQELEQNQVRATSAVLKAAAFYVGHECQQQNDTFKLCKSTGAPGNCITENLSLLKCYRKVFEQMDKCAKQFTNFYKCLDFNNHDFVMCRAEEGEFGQCMEFKKKLWIAQGPSGGFKDDNTIEDCWQYRRHVRKNKQKYD